MRFERLSSVGVFVVVLALSLVTLGLQGIKLEAMTFHGKIAAVSEDRKFIVVDGGKVSRIVISSGTKIVDEKGTVLGTDSLRPKLSIEVEGLYNPKGPFFAKKVIVKVPKGAP